METPARRYEDPLARLDFDALDRDCWWMPPGALALAGVPAFEALPLALRRRVSHVEYIHLLHAGLWLESVFIARMAGLAQRSEDPATRAQLLELVREEAGHSLMFVELLAQGGFPLQPAPKAAIALVEHAGRIVPSGSALFWALVVLGEELPDRLNRLVQRGVEDATLSALVYRMSRIHTRDEAAHAAYARGRCTEATAASPPMLRALLAPSISLGVALYARYVCYPPASLYARAGLDDARRWRGLALANPVRRRQVTLLLRPTLEFLRRCGWPLRSRWLAPAGVDAS